MYWEAVQEECHLHTVSHIEPLDRLAPLFPINPLGQWWPLAAAERLLPLPLAAEKVEAEVAALVVTEISWAVLGGCLSPAREPLEN